MFIVKVALRGYYKHHCWCISAVQSVEIIFRNSHLICSGALQIHMLHSVLAFDGADMFFI